MDSALGSPDVGCCVWRFQLSVFVVVGGKASCLKGRLVSLPKKAFRLAHVFATGFAHAVRQFFEDPSLEVWEERAFCQGLADPEERFR